MEELSKEYISPKDYIDGERISSIKHEYNDGEVFALSGAKMNHNIINVNLASEISIILKNRKCSIFSNDMRVSVSEKLTYTYPDIVIVCGELLFEDNQLDTLKNPAVIIEILSDSSEHYDRVGKFRLYKNNLHIKEYLLVSQKEPFIESYTRTDTDTWAYNTYESFNAVLKIDTIQADIPLSEIYDKIDFSKS